MITEPNAVLSPPALPHPLPLTEHAWPDEAPPMVSVCCITYNHARFVRECLDGILKQQTTFPVEILLHDDASTDGTADIVREIAAAHPRLVKPVLQVTNQYSRGLKPNVNFNFPRARGRYLALCDGDDVWRDPRKLQTQVEFLESDPCYVMCFHNAVVIDAEGRTVSASLLKPAQQRDLSADELLVGARIPASSRVFRKVVSRFPPEMNTAPHGDAFMTALLSSHGGAKYLGQVQPGAYRRHAGGVYSGMSRRQKNLNLLDTRLQIHRYLVREGRTDDAERYFRAAVLPAARKTVRHEHPLMRAWSRWMTWMGRRP